MWCGCFSDAVEEFVDVCNGRSVVVEAVGNRSEGFLTMGKEFVGGMQMCAGKVASCNVGPGQHQ